MQLTRAPRSATVVVAIAWALSVVAARAQSPSPGSVSPAPPLSASSAPVAAPSTVPPAPPAPVAAPSAIPSSAEPQVGSDYVVHVASEAAEYGDTDHVFVFTPSITGSVANPVAGWSVDGSYLVDVISAASVDIVSTASRRWTEVRQAGAFEANYQPRSFGVTGSGAVSVEPDYVSWAAGLAVTQDLRFKNLTLYAGYDHEHDVAGRTGTPFSVYSHASDVDHAKVGLTVVVDRSTIATAFVDAEFVNGDTSKPYRYIPLFAPGTRVARGASIDTVNALRLPERPIEQLPLTRNRYALTLRVARRFRSSTLRVDQRFYDDTWGLEASSTDARYLVDVSRRLELGPHARVHGQSAVDFWQLAYVLRPGFDVPVYRTGNRELGPLVNVTAGGSVRLGVGPGRAPSQWTLELDLGATYSWYLDDLYIRDRISTLGGLSIEGEL
jgi:hypothetical protein